MSRRFGSQNCRDRTPDFQQIIQELQAKQPQTEHPPLSNGYTHSSRPGLPRAASGNRSEFSAKASHIGNKIHNASQKLLRLSQLAKAPPGPFDDNGPEIAALSGAVKQEIQQLNAEIVELQNISSTGSDGNQQTGKHATTVVGSLRSRLATTTRELKDLLTVRSENLKAHEERRSLYSARPDQAVASSSGWAGANGKAFGDRAPLFPPTNRGSAQNQAQSQRPQAQGQTERSPLLGGSQQQSQALMVPQQDTYLNSRAEALHNVESTIHELGGIFQELAHMVQEQGELTIRIDENVDDTVANVDSAQQQLLKYLNTISSNRWLAMKVFFVLMVFTFIFITFVA